MKKLLIVVTLLTGVSGDMSAVTHREKTYEVVGKHIDILARKLDTLQDQTDGLLNTVMPKYRKQLIDLKQARARWNDLESSRNAINTTISRSRKKLSARDREKIMALTYKDPIRTKLLFKAQQDVNNEINQEQNKQRRIQQHLRKLQYNQKFLSREIDKSRNRMNKDLWDKLMSLKFNNAAHVQDLMKQSTNYLRLMDKEREKVNNILRSFRNNHAEAVAELFKSHLDEAHSVHDAYKRLMLLYKKEKRRDH